MKPLLQIGYIARVHGLRGELVLKTFDPQSTAIVRTVVELGHSLGVTVVAEGVESQATWDALRALGCDDAQGWLVAPAMPADTFLSWARERPQGTVGPVTAEGSGTRRRLRSLPA